MSIEAQDCAAAWPDLRRRLGARSETGFPGLVVMTVDRELPPVTAAWRETHDAEVQRDR